MSERIFPNEYFITHHNIVGTKKTLWVNFQEICNTMKRNPEHLFQFMMAELGTEGSIDGNKRLVIRGKFVPKVRRTPEECFLSLLYGNQGNAILAFSVTLVAMKSHIHTSHHSNSTQNFLMKILEY